MQRTIKVLRVALPILFVAFVALIVVSWNRVAGRRGRPAPAPVTSTQRPQDKPQTESLAFDDTQTIGGRVVSRIRAERVVSFESGWTTLENVYMTIYRPNNLTYELACPQAQFNTVTKVADAKGGVKLTSSDGVEIETAEILFDGKRLTNQIPVRFKLDRWNGNAGALDLDVEAETLRLYNTVTATIDAAKPGDLPTTVKGEESLFRRKENNVTFDRNVEMARGADVMRSNQVIGRFTPDRKKLVGFEGTGNASIVMAGSPRPGENLGGRKLITADGFYTEVGPDGEIVAVNARSASGPAVAILDGPPRREITAGGFRVVLGDRSVSEIKAEWQVVMKEMGEVLRQVNAEHVTVSFDPVTNKARTAFLEGAVRYTDPKTTASAFRANYDITGDRLILSTDTGWQATVVSDGSTIRAKQIEFSPKAQTAKATGEVMAQLVSKGSGASADGTNLFPAGAPVFINADSLFMRQSEGVAQFTGNVRAWQNTNTLLANELQVQGQGSVVSARGNVKTVLYNTDQETQKPVPMTSRSEQLIARRNDRRIELAGNVTIEDATRSLSSETAVFFFDTNRKIEKIEAEKSVVVSERPSSRKGTGDKAVYQVARRMIYVTGSPAVLTDTTGTVSGQQIVFDLAKNKVQIVSPTDATKGTYRQQ